MTRFTLVGMVGALREQPQDLLTYHLPVLRFEDGSLWTPLREEWGPEDVRPVPPRDEKFLTLLDPNQTQLVDPGTLVFVVGASFYNRCSRIEALRDKGGVDRGVEALEGGELRELSGVPR